MNNFMTAGKGANAYIAFDAKRKLARRIQEENGHTLAILSKEEFIEIELPKGKSPTEYAMHLINSHDERLNRSDTIAGCIKMNNEEYLFFGNCKMEALCLSTK